MENQKTEVVYTKAKLSKRVVGLIIDFAIFAFTAIILFTISNVIITKTPFYTGKINDLNQMRTDSKLFVYNDTVINYVSDDVRFPTYTDKKDELSSRINDFYHNATYISDITATNTDYDNRRLAATAVVDNVTVNLFEKNGDMVVEKNVSAELLYNFYVDEVEDKCMVLLLNNATYFNLTRFSFLVSLVEIIVGIVISFTLYFYVLPTTCFKRGRQTIAMKLQKIGIININAVNETFGKYTLRFLFMFFVFLPLNFVSFLIPTFVSLGMMYFTKTNSSLVNYVFNDYIIDVESQDIYLDDLERIEAQNSLKQASLQNRDFKLK